MKHSQMLIRNIPNKEGVFLSGAVAPRQLMYTSDKLSEHEIIALHATFLTSGIHYIQVSSLAEGRILVESLLKSLNYFNNVACLTLEHQELDHMVRDIYAELCQQVDSCAQNVVEEYIAGCFYFDFLWIELSDQIFRSDLFSSLKRSIIELGMHHALPIIIVHTKEITVAMDHDSMN